MTGLRAVPTACGLSRPLARAARRRATPLQAVGLGLTAALAVLVMRGSLSAGYGDAAGFMIFLPAVIVATLAAGPVAGMTAPIACLAGGWVLVGATSGIDLFDHIRRVATTNFVLVGLLSAAVAAASRQAIRYLDAASAAQDARRGRLTLASASFGPCSTSPPRCGPIERRGALRGRQ